MLKEKMALRSIWQRFTASVIPVVRADDEPEEADLVNPQAVLREECGAKPQLASLYGRFQKCSDRVQSKSQTTENCKEEFFDYLHELDHCVAHSLFNHLK